MVIKATGISYVIESMLAEIFYRNSINIGLPILECEEVAHDIGDRDDEISINFNTGVITNIARGRACQFEPFHKFIQYYK